MKLKQQFTTLSIAFLLIGCGGDSTTVPTNTNDSPTATTVPSENSTVAPSLETESSGEASVITEREESVSPSSEEINSSLSGEGVTPSPKPSSSTTIDETKMPESISTPLPTVTPLKYTHKVVNNQGVEVEGEVNGYTIKIYSDTKVEANAKHIHKGVVIELNGEKSNVMPIEISYLDKNIMIGIYDKEGKRVTASDSIRVTDVPVVVVELHI